MFRIGDFFESITGYRTAPAQTAPHEWLMLQESTLAAATNGEVFADPTGLFSKTRQGFKNMPDDVRLALISKRLGMIAQAGQYNLPRSLKRGDGAAAWLSIHEFVQATASLVFLVNVPMVVAICRITSGSSQHCEAVWLDVRAVANCGRTSWKP